MSHHTCVTAFGETLTLKEWSARNGVSADAISLRLRAGVPVEEAVSRRNTKVHPGEAWPGANELSWERDERARKLVETKGALTLEEIGDVLGVSREAVRRLEEVALRKYRQGLVRLGLGREHCDHLMEVLARRAA